MESRPTADAEVRPAGQEEGSAAAEAWMARAIALGEAVRGTTSPNPWVGAVLVAEDGSLVAEGATQPPGGPHAEATALLAAGERARGATLYVSLEPCAHQGRTPPCASAIVAAGVRRVVAALVDPDPKVAGSGLAQLRSAGVEVLLGPGGAAAAASLAPYLKHRRTGRPYVVLKLAATLDGRIAAPDGSSRWVTGPEARADAHRLRAESDAVLVGAATVRADDPELTVRDAPGRNPLRVVLGEPPPGARVRAHLVHKGSPDDLLDELGRRGVLQLVVEGGARVAHEFHSAGLVDRYVIYLAPALAGGDDGVPMFRGLGAQGVGSFWRGAFREVKRLGQDLRLDVVPAPEVPRDRTAEGTGAGSHGL